MTDKEILNKGFWIHILTDSKLENNWIFEINKKLKKSWRTELTKGGFNSPFEARDKAEEELRFIINL